MSEYRRLRLEDPVELERERERGRIKRAKERADPVKREAEYARRKTDHKWRFTVKRSRARALGIDFTLTLEQFAELRATLSCPVCGVALVDGTKDDVLKGMARHRLVTIDRIDNTRGYAPDNVTAMCMLCNRTKGDHNEESFQRCAEGLVLYFKRNRTTASSSEGA